MSDDPKRPILVLLTSHWISMLGVALVTTEGFSPSDPEKYTVTCTDCSSRQNLQGC